MKKILAFAGSNSSTSINHTLIAYIVTTIKEHKIRSIRLTDYNIPMYSEDVEKENGFPEMLNALQYQIDDADALVISVNEHNGGWSAYFKNIIDWLSRLDRNFLEGKKVLIMSTSPGKRGGASALEFSKNVLPRFGAEIIDSFSFPSFYENFSVEENKVTNETLQLGLNEVLSTFVHQIQ